jgi:predicted metal-dependent hydrolase
MEKNIQLNEISIKIVRKNIKNTHLSVYPPNGRVILVTPKKTRFEVARAYAISKIKWIRTQKAKFKGQVRELPRKFIDRESHQVFGNYYLMKVIYANKKPNVSLSNKEIVLSVRPNSNQKKRSQIIENWQKLLLYDYVYSLIKKWEKKLDVKVKRLFIRKMKTKWGSCNKSLGYIRMNTELVKKPKDLIEYVVIHEMAHLIETRHNDRFVKILDKHCPFWRDHRSELNKLPLAAEKFKIN